MRMRRVLFALLVVLACAAPTLAQETYSLPASAGNVASLTLVITGKNGNVCAASGLVRACTQAQVCTAANVPGGASCTAAQARTAGVRIYPLTQPGREEFTTFEIALPKFLELVAQEQAERRRAFCASWLAHTQGERDAICTGGCDPLCF